MTAYAITPVDTWFFRDARPFEMVGGAELSSTFPPPARTVASALAQARRPGETRRTAEGKTATLELPPRFADCRGPYVAHRPAGAGAFEPLYPVPLDLLRHDDGRWLRLDIPEPGEAVHCDLGRVLLPKLPDPKRNRGAEPVAGWLTAAGLAAWQRGDVPAGAPILRGDLYREEPRIGLGRDNARRTAAEGLLFNTRHLRLSEGEESAGLLIDLAWPADGVGDWPGGLVKFGGEGRLAEVRPVEAPERPEPPRANGGERGLVLLLLTLGQFGNTSVPPGLMKTEREDGRTVFTGELAYVRPDRSTGKIALTVECAVVGKVLREGGWNPHKGRPRRVRSLIPAGSLWYCTLPEQNAETLGAAIAALHGARIGEDSHFGRGELAVGLWRRPGPLHDHG